MAGLTDPRVTYWEPAKWVARLRATMTGGGPVLLRTNMGAGHGGASGRFSRLDEVAIAYAFAIWVVGHALLDRERLWLAHVQRIHMRDERAGTLAVRKSMIRG